MKNLTAIKNLLAFVILATVVSGCTIEPIRSDEKVVIPGAPDWVNKGTQIVGDSDTRLFRGVSSISLRGDMALQKSIVDDASMAEVAKILSSYMDAISTEYLTNSERSGSSRNHEDSVLKKIDESALRQINESVSAQIDDAIARQFKSSVSPRFKTEISNQINDVGRRKIRVAISNQVDFLRELEEDITTQIKEAVANQIKRTIKTNLAGARHVETWRDPKANLLWSLSELDMKYVKSTVSGMSEMNIELKSYFEANAELVFDRIIRERDNVNPFARKY